MRNRAALWRTSASVLAFAAAGLGLAAPRDPQPIRIAVYTDFDPFSNRQRAGIDVELAQRIAEKIGRDADVTPWDSDESLDDDLRYILWGGRRADLMMHVPFDQRYAAAVPQVRLLPPYYREHEVMAYAPSRLASVTSLETFTTHKVGVMLATGADGYLMSALGGRLQNNVRHFLRPREAAAAMKSGEIDAVMGEAVEIESALEAAGVPHRITVPPGAGLALNAWDVGAAVRAEDTVLAAAVQRAIGELRSSGEIERIFTSRGLTYVPPAGE